MGNDRPLSRPVVRLSTVTSVSLLITSPYISCFDISFSPHPTISTRSPPKNYLSILLIKYMCKLLIFRLRTVFSHGTVFPLFGHISLQNRSMCCARGYSRHILFLRSQVIIYLLARAFTAIENRTSKWQPIKLHVKNDEKKRYKRVERTMMLPEFHKHFPAFSLAISRFLMSRC